QFFEGATWDKRAKRPDGVNLMARKGTVEDLAECYALHESLRLPYTKRSWAILPEMCGTFHSAHSFLLLTNSAWKRDQSFLRILTLNWPGNIFRANCRY